VLFGGTNFIPFDDTWIWDGANWTQQSPATVPAGRFRMPMEWAPGNRVLMFGGNGAEVYGDTWTWDGTNWTQH
jgi:hypothetical protein